MGKTVTEPMSPEMMKELQAQAEAAIRAENEMVKARRSGESPLPFAPQHQRKDKATTTPSRLQNPKRGTNWGKVIFYLLLIVALGVGGYLAYVQFG